MFFCVTQIITIETPYQVKEEEDNAMHSTVVIFSSNDNFTLKQVQFCFTQYSNWSPFQCFFRFTLGAM